MGGPSLSIVVTGGGELELEGELDMETAEGLATAIGETVEPGERVVLDLRALDFIDSTGIRVLIQAAKRSGRPLLLRDPCHQVQRVLEIALPSSMAMGVWEFA